MKYRIQMPVKKSLLVGGALLTLCTCSLAKFARLWEPVPLARLFTNVGRYVKDHPKDAQGLYTLGRLHSLAYAKKQDPKVGTVEVIQKDWNTNKPLPLPDFPPYESVQVSPPTQQEKLDADTKQHLLESLRLYARAVELDPKNALYQLGYAWMLEQAAPLLGTAMPPPGLKNGSATVVTWREQSLAAYRKSYSLSLSVDLKSTRNMSRGDSVISVEAGEGMLRLLGMRRQTAAEKTEVARINQEIKSIQSKPGYITPIILSLQPSASLADLLAPDRAVSFDLAGRGDKTRWPWLRPHTGLLVWDPTHSGKIVSGRQLFGSRTWQMFWKDGYEPMAALDDDGDGWLSGTELEGLAVWFDRNGNGRSEKGEVLPVQALNIMRMAAHAADLSEGVPAHRQGIVLKDGTTLPTFDWTPQSLSREKNGNDDCIDRDDTPALSRWE